MQSLAALFQKKQEQQKPVLDDKTVLYVAQNVIVREYGAIGSKNVVPKSFKEGKLTLFVSGSVWKSEVELTRGDLRKEINKACGQKAVQEMCIKTA